jgi:hypothetical protein
VRPVVSRIGRKSTTKCTDFLNIIHRPEIGTSSVDWAQLSRLLSEDGDRAQSLKRCF